ncbi:MAG: hypothetical protein GY832_30190 [Chloroflexi bacterium]|nr:hypothetical protein [Chloroflexota bacterium]
MFARLLDLSALANGGTWVDNGVTLHPSKVWGWPKLSLRSSIEAATTAYYRRVGGPEVSFIG